MTALSLVEKIACLSDADKVWLERLIDRVLISSPPRKSCDCHVVDPEKQPMIIWPSSNEKHPNDLIVQYIDQRMIAMPRVDKNGQKYWKVRKFYEEGENGPVMSQIIPSLTQEELELVKSYQEKKRARMPEQAFTNAEWQAYQKWVESKKVPRTELVQNQGGENALNN